MSSAKAKPVESAGTSRKARADVKRTLAGAFPTDATARMAHQLGAKTETIKALSRKGKLLGQLLETYGAALESSQRTGRAVRFTVDVEPGGAPRITQVEPVGGARPGRVEPAPVASDGDRAFAAARARGRLRVTEILSGDDMLGADDLAKHLGITRATVNIRRQNHQLLGLEGAKRGFRFPEWQVGEDGRAFEALPALFERLGGSPWAVYRFLVQHHPELDGLTGREALRRGRSAKAIEAAESVARAFA